MPRRTPIDPSHHPKVAGSNPATTIETSNDRFDALNALKVRWERTGQDWSPVEEIADDLGESMSAVERLHDPCVEERLVERRGIDQDPEYRLTRSAKGTADHPPSDAQSAHQSR